MNQKDIEKRIQNIERDLKILKQIHSSSKQEIEPRATIVPEPLISFTQYKPEPLKSVIDIYPENNSACTFFVEFNNSNMKWKLYQRGNAANVTNVKVKHGEPLLIGEGFIYPDNKINIFNRSTFKNIIDILNYSVYEFYKDDYTY